MVDGVQLTLMIGPAVPVPVPREVLDALTAVTVNTGGDGPGGFQLTFTLSTTSPLQTLFLASAGAPIPLIRVLIVATVNGTPEVLMDGVMTNHQVTAGQHGQATLTVIGEDLTRVMTYLPFDGTPWPAMPAEVRVLAILAKYAVVGVVPIVVPSILVDVPIPVDRIPLQQGNDLEYVRNLAEEVGYVFYMDPGPAPGTSRAYWGPEIKIGEPQPALNVDFDQPHVNVETFSPSYESDRRLMPAILIQNQETKVPIPIPIPDITPLNPPLGIVKPLPTGLEFIEGTAKLSPIRAAAIGLAKAAKSADHVSATGTLDVLRYGRILKARKLVGVRGAGLAFDGLYYVKSVSHELKRGSYKQSFMLSRNALVSTVSQVPA